VKSTLTNWAVGRASSAFIKYLGLSQITEDWGYLEIQQTDFMSGLLGGPRIFGGRTPRDAHCHLFVTKEIFQIRHQLLGESLAEAGVPVALRERWLKLDAGFEAALVKQSPDECKGRYRTEPVIVVPKPDHCG